MKDIQDVVACFSDHGLFTHVAIAMAAQCKKVYFTGPPEQVMRRLQDDIIAVGLENIERVESIWQVDDECDVFVFPDVGFGWEQKKLVRDGRAVWGHHGADVLEVKKGLFLETLEEMGMPVPPHKVVVGVDDLLDYLWDKDDKWVKVSKWRNDWETFHWRNLELDAAYIRGHQFNRCPMRDIIKFYVFDKIDTTIEDGIDAWCIDGQWPRTVLHGMEKKDKSFLGAMQSMEAIDESVRGVNDTFAPVLAQFGYRGFFSTEVRPPYFIDPTCRAGSPPSQLQTALITNLPEVIYRGAHGECVEPEYDDPIGAQVLITTDRELPDYLTFAMPDELRPFVKSSFCFESDGALQVAPNPLENFAGWLVATGKTIKAVVDRLKDLKEMLPAGFDCDITSMASLLTELEDAKEQDIEITDQPLPEPEIVIDD